MKYEGRKTHEIDKFYVRAGEGKVKIEEGVIDKKEKKIQGVLSPKILGRGRDQMQNYEENVQFPTLI